MVDYQTTRFKLACDKGGPNIGSEPNQGEEGKI